MPTTTVVSLQGADLLSLSTLDAAQLAAIFDTAGRTKRDPTPFRQALAGRSVILLFEKPSLRTRVTFELGPNQMGGTALYFDHSKDRIGQRESVRDYAKNLERWFDLIVARVYSHAVLEQLAEHASIPVVNALSDQFHPCQALADYLTLIEQFGGLDRLRGLKLAFVGDGNNVCASLMHGAAILGVQLMVITPPRYEPEPEVVAESRRLAEGAGTGGSIDLSNDPAAVKGCRAVYTDSWVSMGDESEAAQRRKAFARYRVNAALMAKAGANGDPAKFMHCLPAHRGEEVTDDVIDSPNAVVYDQAENRLHVQNSLMLHILGAA
ncbi:MAG: ornithine carbamoyltransferase [Phycisphaerales bacterium]